ncbi:hypothetical protein EAF04_007470 [Stromatinia cepivora]|nr:hypothetical protein EAF04_007470 [Stromatinia cepivora]
MFLERINHFLSQYFVHSGNERTSNPFYVPSAFFVIIITWATWRFWKFTLKPLCIQMIQRNTRTSFQVYFHSRTLGQAPAFLKDSQGLFKRAREYFGNTREPFAITIMGQQIYVVTNPDDLPTLYKSTSTLTFDGFIQDFFEKEGVTPEAIEIMFTKQAKSQKKVLAHAGEDFFKQQLQPGGHLQPLFNSIQSKISECIQWNKLSHKTILSTTGRTKKNLPFSILSRGLGKTCIHRSIR